MNPPSEQPVEIARVIVAGIDPGFTALGIVLVERTQPHGMLELVHGEVVSTKKAEKKERSDLRVTNDDVRRYQEVFRRVHALLLAYRPIGMGVEAYRVAPRFGRRRMGGGGAGEPGAEAQDSGGAGAGAKTMAVYGGIVALGTAMTMYVAPWLPNDLKKKFTGKMSSSKEEVWEAVAARLPGLQELLAKSSKGFREHLGDAAGHALLTFAELDRLRHMLGLPVGAPVCGGDHG